MCLNFGEQKSSLPKHATLDDHQPGKGQVTRKRSKLILRDVFTQPEPEAAGQVGRSIFPVFGPKQTVTPKAVAKKNGDHSPHFLTLQASLTHTSACFLRLVMAPTRPRPASIMA